MSVLHSRILGRWNKIYSTALRSSYGVHSLVYYIRTFFVFNTCFATDSLAVLATDLMSGQACAQHEMIAFQNALKVSKLRRRQQYMNLSKKCVYLFSAVMRRI